MAAAVRRIRRGRAEQAGCGVREARPPSANRRGSAASSPPEGRSPAPPAGPPGMPMFVLQPLGLHARIRAGPPCLPNPQSGHAVLGLGSGAWVARTGHRRSRRAQPRGAGRVRPPIALPSSEPSRKSPQESPGPSRHPLPSAAGGPWAGSGPGSGISSGHIAWRGHRSRRAGGAARHPVGAASPPFPSRPTK